MDSFKDGGERIQRNGDPLPSISNQFEALLPPLESNWQLQPDETSSESSLNYYGSSSFSRPPPFPDFTNNLSTLSNNSIYSPTSYPPYYYSEMQYPPLLSETTAAGLIPTINERNFQSNQIYHHNRGMEYNGEYSDQMTYSNNYQNSPHQLTKSETEELDFLSAGNRGSNIDYKASIEYPMDMNYLNDPRQYSETANQQNSINSNYPIYPDYSFGRATRCTNRPEDNLFSHYNYSTNPLTLQNQFSSGSNYQNQDWQQMNDAQYIIERPPTNFAQPTVQNHSISNFTSSLNDYSQGFESSSPDILDGMSQYKYPINTPESQGLYVPRSNIINSHHNARSISNSLIEPNYQNYQNPSNFDNVSSYSTKKLPSKRSISLPIRSTSSRSSSSLLESSFSGDVKPFVIKLMHLLDNPDSFGRVIAWDNLGKTVIISSLAPQLINGILPTFFQHRSVQSFCRQFIIYGFTKISTSSLTRILMQDSRFSPTLHSYIGYRHSELRSSTPTSRYSSFLPTPSKARKERTEAKTEASASRKKNREELEFLT